MRRAPHSGVRWHRRTPDFPLIEQRLTEAGYGHRIERHDGNLWMPLELEGDTGPATRQIERLATQAVELYKTAAGLAAPE